MGRLLVLPELNVALFSFVFHFVWELLQVPTYAGMAQLDHWTGVLVCTQASLGDVGFALIAFWITAGIARSRRWIVKPTLYQVLIFVGIGVALTIGFESFYTRVTFRWTYSELMPIVPPFGVGLSPLVQWIVVPLLVLFVVGRQIRPPANRL